MNIRVSPDLPVEQVTHHISIQDKNGKVVGITICDPSGKPRGLFEYDYPVVPAITTAFKQTTGSNGYDIFDIPYSPVVQDDISGGRGSLDFERDSTKYYDSYRTASGRQNKAFAGPLEQYATGAHRSAIQSMPGSTDWVTMTGSNRYVYKRFQATALTTSKVWLNLRRLSKPGNLTIELRSDNAGVIGTLLTSKTIPYTWTNDILSEWVNDTLAQTLTNGAYYWLVIYSDANDNDKKHWKIGVKESVGTTYTSSSYTTTPTAASFDLYYRLTDADSEKTCIDFEYKEQQYFVISGSSGAPKLYMAGDRGAADSNTGQLDRLIDATKSWTVNEHVGVVILITDGPGKLEPQPWRTVVSNGTNYLVFDTPLTIEHTTATEYVLLSPKIKEITGHGLTAPVTDVFVSPTGVVYFCMGDSVAVRRLRAYNDTGVWRDFDDAANCQANETFNAVFMALKPQNNRIVWATNSTVAINISTNTSVPAWGTAITFSTATNVDNQYRRINGIIVHPDASGNEAVWILKTDMVFVARGTTSFTSIEPAGPDEIRNVRSITNGVRPMKHDVYLYFPLLQGLLRYYGGAYSDVGPNLGEGLPENRRGVIVDQLGYPGKFFIAIDAGSTGYSSIMDSGGWHERYRAPKGQRIRTIAFQVIPGTALDRLWVYQGNDLVWLPFPSNTNELEDSSYPYTSEFAVELSRMHAGMYDVQKMIAFLKLQTDQLEKDSEGRAVCWFELDYKLNDDDEWTQLTDIFTSSPTQTVDFRRPYFGLTGKRLKFRLRGYTRDMNKTPVFLAIVIFAVIRVDIKEMYGSFDVLCEDNEPVGLREVDGSITAQEKLQLLRDWADASSEGMLLMNSVATHYDNKMVFMNLGDHRQVRFKQRDGSDAFVVSMSLQDA